MSNHLHKSARKRVPQSACVSSLLSETEIDEAHYHTVQERGKMEQRVHENFCKELIVSDHGGTNICEIHKAKLSNQSKENKQDEHCSWDKLIICKLVDCKKRRYNQT